MGVRLPAEYQEVECLESPVGSGCFINTGIVFDSESYLKIKYQSFSDDDCFGYVISGSNLVRAGRVSLQWHTISNAYVTGSGQNEIYADKNVIRINGVEYQNADQSAFTGLEVGLYGTVRASSQIGTDNRCIFYYAEIGKNGIAVQKLVPCYRKSDDKPGMYDLISGTFFINSGTGEFTVGPDVIDSISPWLVARRRLLMRRKDELPAAYRRLHYLESDGAAYIDTLLVPANDLTHEVKFQFTKSLPTNHTATVFGCYATSLRARCQFNYSTDGVLGWGRAFGRYAGSYDNNEHVAVISNGSFLVDNVNLYTPTSSDFSVGSGGTQPIVLFGTNAIGVVNADTITDGLRISSYKVYRNGDIRRNFIPCIRKSDGAKGMYETVGKLFYANAGSGEFSGN